MDRSFNSGRKLVDVGNSPNIIEQFFGAEMLDQQNDVRRFTFIENFTNRFVITSYSIHYTKLYEDIGYGVGRMGHLAHRRRMVGKHQDPVLPERGQPGENGTDHQFVKRFDGLDLVLEVAGVRGLVGGLDVQINEVSALQGRKGRLGLAPVSYNFV